MVQPVPLRFGRAGPTGLTSLPPLLASATNEHRLATPDGYCYLIHTNVDTRTGYSLIIDQPFVPQRQASSGFGPRYCPSIGDG